MSNILTGQRILVVEDEALVSMLIDDILHDLGCEVIGPFARVAPALTVLASTPIDGAVLDVNLRGERSYRIVDALAERHLPHIFVTGYGAGGIDPAYRHVKVVRKPFNRNSIASALEDSLRLAAAPER